jgi:citrate lyase synthetase
MFVAYFGGFKPPHKGHLAVVEEYLSMPDVQTVYVVYGDKNRLSADGKVILNSNHTKMVWELFISTLDQPERVKLVKADGNTLVAAASLAWSDEVAGSTITAGYGAKEPVYGKKFIAIVQSLTKEKGHPLAEPVMVPTHSNEPSISSTLIRSALSTNDLTYLKDVVPTGVKCEEYLNILK